MKALNAHGLHSPFLFELYNEVIKKTDRANVGHLLKLRKNLFQLSGNLKYKDPKTGDSKTVNLKKFGRKSASSHRFSYFLLKLINHLGYQSILETGTCTGVNAAYLSQSNASEVWSIEGAKELAKVAMENLAKNDVSNVNIIVGNVFEKFPKVLEHSHPDLVFLDADHRSETIYFYLKTMAEHHPKVKCIVIHDIHWSKDMKTAWQQIIEIPHYNLTIDIYQAGIIFPDYAIEKQHFVVKF
jgi:predicted O-methyltransferase YrrM